MNLLYILYSLLAGALFNMFIAGREKFKARFSAVMHSLGTPVRLMKRFAVTSAASLRKSTEHINTAAKNAVRIELEKFRVAAVRRSISHIKTWWKSFAAVMDNPKRGISRLKTWWKSLTMMRDNPRRSSVRRFFGQLREKVLIATQNMRRGIGHPKTWWKAIVTIRGDPGRGISHLKTWWKSITTMRDNPHRGISHPKTWWKSITTMRDNPRRGNIRVFGQFIPRVRIKINTLRRCFSHPKTWWKSITTMRDNPHHGVSRLKTWWKSVTTMKDDPRRGISRMKTWWKTATTMRDDPRRGINRPKTWWKSLTMMRDNPRRSISHIKTWWKSIVMMGNNPQQGSTRVFFGIPKIFGNLSSGGAGLGTPEKFFLRKFILTLRKAGTSAKAVWPSIRFLPNARLLSTLGTSMELLMKTVADRARLMLHFAGQKTRTVRKILLRLSLFPVRIVAGTETAAKEKHASFGTSAALSSWIFPRDDGNDLFITQAYAVTETAKNIIIY